MNFLYVPWRAKYLLERRNEKNNITSAECVFCLKISNVYETHNETDLIEHDRQHFVLGRYEYNGIVLNLHPYNTGHLMVIPYKHVKTLDELSSEERTELINLTSLSSKILQDIMRAEGINIGMNIGKAAGAGLPSHLHTHVLPRWTGDTNFLPLLSETKTISMDLRKVFNDLKPHFEATKI